MSLSACSLDKYGTYRLELYNGQEWCIFPYPYSFSNGPNEEGVPQTSPRTTIWMVYLNTSNLNVYYGISGNLSSFSPIGSTYYTPGLSSEHVSMVFDDVGSKILSISWPNSTITVNRATASITFTGIYGTMHNNIDIQPFSDQRDSTVYYLSPSATDKIYARFLRDGFATEYLVLSSGNSLLNFKKLLFSWTSDERQNLFGLNNNDKGFILRTRKPDPYIVEGCSNQLIPISGFYDYTIIPLSSEEEFKVGNTLIPISGLYDYTIISTSSIEEFKIDNEIIPLSGNYELMVISLTSLEDFGIGNEILPLSGLYDQITVNTYNTEEFRISNIITPYGGEYSEI